MDKSQIAAFLPGFLGSYLEDISPPEPISPGLMHDEHPSWSFTYGDVLMTAAVSPNPLSVRFTAGLALDVTYAPEVSHVVNGLNNKELIFGRMFLFGNDESARGCIVMQEIVMADSLDADHVPTLQNLLRIVATLGGQSGRLAPQLRQQFGGRPFRTEDAFFLSMSG